MMAPPLCRRTVGNTALIGYPAVAGEYQRLWPDWRAGLILFLLLRFRRLDMQIECHQEVSILPPAAAQGALAIQTTTPPSASLQLVVPG